MIRYRRNWPDTFSELDIELTCFRNNLTPEQHGLGKAEHFWNIVSILWGPESKKPFVRNPWSEKMVFESCRWQYLGVTGPANSSKCLAPETGVLMFDGSTKRAKDIRVGDKLMGDDSTARTVTHAGTGRSNMVRIIPNTGETWECNDDHVLSLKRTWAGRKGYRRVGEFVDISVKDYLASSQSFKRQYRMRYTGVDFPEQPVQFDPRAYGIWLGDGKTGFPHITADDSEPEVIRYITDYFTGLGYEVKGRLYGKKTCRAYLISGNYKHGKFASFVRKSSPNGEKRILPEYLFNSRKVRLELLAGLIDSDGHGPSKSNGFHATNFSIACAYPGLSKDIVYLARSLGFRVGVTPSRAICNGRECTYDSIRICGNVHEIPALRKKCAKRTRHLSCGDAIGFRVEGIGEGDWAGFTVDGNGRFLLSDFTVTHNSDTFALWSLVNFLASPAHTLILITSTSLTESRLRIWGSVEEYFQAVPGLPGKLVSSIGAIRYEDPETGERGSDRCGIRLIAGDASHEKDAVQKLIGIKRSSGALILVGDELPELSPSILEAAKSNLSSQPKFQFVGLGNAKSQFDAHGTLLTPRNGWKSLPVDPDEWETELGYAIRFDGEKSPNILAGRVLYPFLPKKDWVDKQKADLGENSLSYFRMVRGWYSPDGSTEGIYSEADITSPGADEKKVKFVGSPMPVAAQDPSFTNGGDETILQFGLFGETEDGIPTLLYTERVSLKSDATIKKTRNFQIAEKTKEECEKRGVIPFNFGFDSTASGGPYGDILSEIWSSEIYRVPYSGAASAMSVGSVNPKPANECYGDRSSEIWHVGKEFMRSGQLKGVDGDMARDLVSRRSTTLKRGKNIVQQVEPKKETRKRTGRSPDKGDAALILLDLCRTRLKFRAQTIVVVNQAARKDFNKMARTVEEFERSAETNLIGGNDPIPKSKPPMRLPQVLVSGDGWADDGLM